MYIIPNLTDQRASNLISRAKIISRTDIWNQYWVLLWEIKNLIIFILLIKSYYSFRQEKE